MAIFVPCFISAVREIPQSFRRLVMEVLLTLCVMPYMTTVYCINQVLVVVFGINLNELIINE